MGAVPNPVCWDGRRARGFGEPIPSMSIQRWPCWSRIHHIQHLHGPAQHHSVTSATAAVPVKLQSWSQHLPALHFLLPGGPSQGTSPHPFVPAREVFCCLWPPAQGEGRGSVSITAGSWQGWRVPTLLPSGSIPRAASHPAWGPGKRRREMSRSWGSAREGSAGRNTRKPQEKTLCILRKCQ